MKLLAAATITFTDQNDACFAMLSSDTLLVPCDSQGMPKLPLDSSPLTSRMSVLMGGAEQTGWVFTRTHQGVTSSVDASGLVSVTGISADNGYVEVSASKAGQSSLVKKLVVSKVYQGETGNLATDFTIELSPRAFLVSSRGQVLDSQSLAATCRKMNIVGSAQVSWVADGVQLSAATGEAVNITIPALSMLDSFTLECTVEGYGSKSVDIQGIPNGSAKPLYLRVCTIAPTETSEGPLMGSPVAGGDFYLDSDNIPHWYNGSVWNPVDGNTPNYSQVMAAVMGDVFNSGNIVPVASAVYGYFKSLAAEEAFLKYLQILNAKVGNGTGTEGTGFRFRASSYDSAGNYDPIFDLYNGNNQLFKVDVNTGIIYFGQYFWYDPSDGALHTPNDTTVITATGKIYSTDGEFIGTLKTGPNARGDARVAIRDQSGILSRVFASSGGTDNMQTLTEGQVAGTFKIKISSLFSQQSYEVGDTGPAGYPIFYKYGDLYLETAPASEDFDHVKWGYSDDTRQITVRNGYGDGYENTNDYATLGFPVAVTVRAKTLGGYSDWYVPSYTEIKELYRVMGKAIFNETEDSIYRYYFTSTQSLRSGTTASIYAFDTKNNVSSDMYYFSYGSAKFIRKFNPPITYPTFQWSSDNGATWSSAVAFNGVDSYVLGTTGITITFSSMLNHAIGDTWTLTQGAMRGLSIIDSSGTEYFSASNGVVTATKIWGAVAN
jgi:hypothetical protein